MNATRFALVASLLLPATLPLWQTDDTPAPPVTDPAEVIELRERIRELEAENQNLTAQLEDLRAELTWVSEQRYVERLNHQTWLEVVAALTPEKVRLSLPTGLVGRAEAPPEPEVVEPDPSLERGAEIVISLRNLFKSEGLFAYDLLEGGRCADGGLGPVVFRLLDDRGRLAGSLAADRLALEASRAGRIITMVLTGGEERHAGRTTAFTERRIPLLGVDPRPWLARVPELFPTADLGAPLDDGLWNLSLLRGRLNKLFAEDVAAGYLRLDGLDGVAGDLLFGVDLAELDATGRVRRHLFADTAEFARLDRGIVLQLFGCVAIRGGTKTPFPGGVHRVFLPRANADVWAAAKIPGFTEPESPPAE
jgi:hypothetical protein